MSFAEFDALYKEWGCMVDTCEQWATDDITPEIAWYIAQKNGFCLRYIPKEMITEELAWLAIRDGDYTDGNALVNVPDHLLTYEMCLEAVKCEEQTNLAIEWVPDRFHTYELSCEAVSNPVQFYSSALEFVKNQFKTKELCLKAIELHTDAINHLPYTLKTSAFYNEALAVNPKVFKYIPLRNKSKQMCENAVRALGSNLQFVPERFKTQEMCLEAVLHNPQNIKFVPAEYCT
jgi:hypothetical protein